MATERLYLRDPLLLSFEATLLSRASYEGKPSLVLDASAFFPEGGGQLGDRGELSAGERRVGVVDVQIDDEGVVHHLVEGDGAGLEPGARLVGRVDEARRRDHMAQHTGQHMLSKALLDLAAAETVSARLGAESSTIDLSPASVDERLIEAAVDRVNEAVLDDRPVRVLFPTESELAAMPLRRRPKVSTGVRVVDVEGFDLSPCGGTHCLRTGQVGMVHVTGVEKYKGMLRLTFLAGSRALRDYRAKDAALRELSRSMSCGPFDVAHAVGKLRSELKARTEQLGSARGELASLLAERLLADHPRDPSGTTRVVALRPSDDLASLRTLAGALARRADVVALLACRDPASAELLVVIERGQTASFDAGRWLKAAAQAHGGKGGGRAERAEGRLSGATDWATVASQLPAG